MAQLEKDLKSVLNRAAAPPLVRAAQRLTAVPPRSILWYEYTRLNYAVGELDEHALRAMPAHERVARFKSARLLKRLEGASRTEALAKLQKTTPQHLDPADDVLVYRLSEYSYAFNVRPPTLGYALSPQHDPAFLGESAYAFLQKHGIPSPGHVAGSIADAELTNVSIVAIDRVAGFIALQPGYKSCILAFEHAGAADFTKDVMLDPVGSDFLSRKILLTLQGIGQPASAGEDAGAMRALGVAQATPSAITAETPASEFLWQAPELAETLIPRDVVGARAALEARDEHLNESQWKAWESALTRRLTLIWGPPGTGKSQTLRAIIVGAVWNAYTQQRPLRLVITSNTYTAIDNVLFEVDALLEKVIGRTPYRLFRLQSEYRDPPPELAKHPAIERIIIKAKQTPIDVQDLQAMLNHPTGIIVVAGHPQQLHNLAMATKNKTKRKEPKYTQQRWFDLLIIDEASQLGVADTTLIVSKAANHAAFILAGDDKQLPPIQPATPPEGLEHIVGSVYNYIRHHHQIIPAPLQTNYRSCQTLVDFTKRAGYDPGLHAYHTDLRLTFLSPGLPQARPDTWPDALYWTTYWNDLLDPQHPAICFIYDDDVAGQSNPFEANAVAALIWLLYGRLDRQLAGERIGEGYAQPSGVAHDEKSFWERAVGVVTPHRAQMSTIVNRLQALFPDHSPTAIWNAVDTVERFQGQQRDVIIASFGLGDVDLIRSEDEFLYSLNRFNVMASRARAKLIVFLTRSLVDHLADDSAVLEESRLLKNYAESFCQSPTPIILGFRDGGADVLKPGTLRVGS